MIRKNRLVDYYLKGNFKNDEEFVSEDWKTLMTPLINVLSLSEPEDVDKVYCSVESNKYSLEYEPFTLMNKLDLSETYESTVKNYILLGLGAKGITPKAILGEPGIGKTTWLKHLFYISSGKYKLDKGIHFCYYDHNSRVGDITMQTNDQVKIMKQNITEELTEILSKLLIQNKLDKHIDQLEGVPNLFLSDNQSRNLANKIKNSVNLLKSINIEIWVAIDNLDRYSSEVQKAGFQIANNLSKELYIHTVVPLRPYSYVGDISSMGYPPVILKPPNLLSVIQKRLDFIRDNPKESGLEEISNNLVGITLDLLYTKFKIRDSLDICKLSNNVVNKIISNEILTELLQSIRINNIRKCLTDISNLLTFGHFSSQIVQSLEKEEHFLSKEEFITSYLRGPYKHFWGRTRDYHISITNLFDIPEISSKNKLIGIRALQFLDKATKPGVSCGMSYYNLRSKLIYYYEDENDVDFVIRFLLHRRLIQEISRLLNWRDENNKLHANDIIIISTAGKYYLENFLNDYALRYCEAMSNTYRFKIDQLNKLRTDVGIFSISNNAYILVKDIADKLKDELEYLRGISDSKFNNKLYHLYNDLDSSEGFFYNIVNGIYKYLSIKIIDNPKIIDKFQDIRQRDWVELIEKWKELLNFAETIHKEKEEAVDSLKKQK